MATCRIPSDPFAATDLEHLLEKPGQFVEMARTEGVQGPEVRSVASRQHHHPDVVTSLDSRRELVTPTA
jgi:hypothetical protein